MRVFLWIGPLALLSVVLLWARLASRPEDGTAAEESPAAEAAAAGKVVLTEARREAAGIETCACGRVTLPEVLSTTGAIGLDADRVAHVGPRLAGIVREVPAKAVLGARVEQGDELLWIESTEFGRAQVEWLKASAALDARQKACTREKGLFDQQIGSGREYLEAEADLAQARVDLQAARNQLEVLGVSQADLEALARGEAPLGRFLIRAPISGTVIDKHVVQGEHVDTESVCFTIADLARVWLLADVYERDIARVSRGQKAEVSVAAWPEPFLGEIAMVGDTMDETTRTANVRVVIANGERRLKPGMFGTVRITLRERRDAIAVPEAAIQTQGRQEVVFVERGAGTFEACTVRSGLRHGGLVEILAGLAGGEKVVTAGGFLLVSELEKGSFEGD